MISSLLVRTSLRSVASLRSAWCSTPCVSTLAPRGVPPTLEPNQRVLTSQHVNPRALHACLGRPAWREDGMWRWFDERVLDLRAPLLIASGKTELEDISSRRGPTRWRWRLCMRLAADCTWWD
eukprot:SAG11_NODE_3779_length_2232_cov_3.488045_1_plen_122_part_10